VPFCCRSLFPDGGQELFEAILMPSHAKQVFSKMEHFHLSQFWVSERIKRTWASFLGGEDVILDAVFLSAVTVQGQVLLVPAR